jgi:hypothetical protein
MKPKLVNKTVVEQTDNTPSSNLKMVRVEETPRCNKELSQEQKPSASSLSDT